MAERNAPTTGKLATTWAEMITIVTHPAFRIGFLDAQNGKPFDHDDIIGRIEGETPQRALDRIGWGGHLFGSGAANIELAQYRYEEGRLLVILKGLSCRGWAHPDYPPVQVISLITEQCAATRETADA